MQKGLLDNCITSAKLRKTTYTRFHPGGGSGSYNPNIINYLR